MIPYHTKKHREIAGYRAWAGGYKMSMKPLVSESKEVLKKMMRGYHIVTKTRL